MTTRFFVFLRTLTHQLLMLLHSRHPSKVSSQIVLILQTMALDYVESDYDVINKSRCIVPIREILTNQELHSTTVYQVAYELFELLISRCVCEGDHEASIKEGRLVRKPQDKHISSGHKMQQRLLDVTVTLLQRSLQGQSVGVQSPHPVRRPSLEEDPYSHASKMYTSLQGAFHISPTLSLVAPKVALPQSLSITFQVCFDEDHEEGWFSSGRFFSIGNPLAKVMYILF